MTPQFPMNHKAGCGEAATEEAELGPSAVWADALKSILRAELNLSASQRLRTKTLSV